MNILELLWKKLKSLPLVVVHKDYGANETGKWLHSPRQVHITMGLILITSQSFTSLFVVAGNIVEIEGFKPVENRSPFKGVQNTV